MSKFTEPFEKVLSSVSNIISKFPGKNIFNAVNGDRGNIGLFGNSGQNQFFSTYTGNTLNQASVMQLYKGWVFSCANINAAGVGAAPLRLYGTSKESESKDYLHDHRVLKSSEVDKLTSRATNKTLSKITNAIEVVEISDHPILRLLRQVNSNHNYYETMEGTCIGLDMIGNSFWYIVKNSFGIPEELWLLMPQYMTVVPGKREFVKGYLYGADRTQMVPFLPDEIIHFKTPNPNNLYYGIGCVQAEISAVERDGLMDSSENNTLANQARPDFIVKYTGGKMDQKTLNDVERMWNNSFKGPRRKGRIKVMDDDWDLKTIGYKPSEMEYLSGRTWTLKQIAAAFGVPYSMLDSSDTKKATSESAKLWHSQNALLPRLSRIEEKLNEKLVPLYDERMFLMFDNIVPENKDLELRENDTYVRNGVKSINEVRRSLGLMAFPDPMYDKPLLQQRENASRIEDDVKVKDEEDE